MAVTDRTGYTLSPRSSKVVLPGHWPLQAQEVVAHCSEPPWDSVRSVLCGVRRGCVQEDMVSAGLSVLVCRGRGTLSMAPRVGLCSLCFLLQTSPEMGRGRQRGDWSACIVCNWGVAGHGCGSPWQEVEPWSCLGHRYYQGRFCSRAAWHLCVSATLALGDPTATSGVGPGWRSLDFQEASPGAVGRMCAVACAACGPWHVWLQPLPGGSPALPVYFS